jgi:hypothetical protein
VLEPVSQKPEVSEEVHSWSCVENNTVADETVSDADPTRLLRTTVIPKPQFGADDAAVAESGAGVDAALQPAAAKRGFLTRRAAAL